MPDTIPTVAGDRAWKVAVDRYSRPHAGRAAWQIINSAGAYLGVWVVMYFTVQISWWLTAPLIVLAAGLLVRAFIIAHDCGHGSFLKSRTANDVWGTLCALLSYTPYYQWRWQHSLHHASAGDLGRRGTGDVWTMTVDEYRRSPWRVRLAYRFLRHPVVLFVIGPPILFLIMHRIPAANAGRRERNSVWLANASALASLLVMGSIFGFVNYLIIQVAVMCVAGMAGIWLFYVQHQFEDVYWAEGEAWSYEAAALEGSSFYKLPRVLQWFSGNIGFHHVHHLNPRVPNYFLERCHESSPVFRDVKPMTFRTSLRSLTFRLWDEASRKMVGFAEVGRRDPTRG